jgi:ribosomal protein S27AE
MLETSIEFAPAMNFIWLPWMSALVVSDRLLERLLRRHLQGAECPRCSYNLIGLDIYEKLGYKLVQCPECGKEVILADNNLTESDIDPTLASS